MDKLLEPEPGKHAMNQTFPDVPQLDGNFSFISSSTNTSSSFITDQPSPEQHEHDPDGNLLPEYDPGEILQPNFPPSVAVINARSVYNKKTSLYTVIHDSNIDICVISETWERRNLTLETFLKPETFHVVSRKRDSTNPGGGVAMIINPLYSIEDPDLTPPKGVEVIWRIIKILKDKKLYKIAAAAVNVLPRSEFKEETTEFLIMSIHYLRSKFSD